MVEKPGGRRQSVPSDDKTSHPSSSRRNHFHVGNAIIGGKQNARRKQVHKHKQPKRQDFQPLSNSNRKKHQKLTNPKKVGQRTLSLAEYVGVCTCTQHRAGGTRMLESEQKMGPKFFFFFFWFASRRLTLYLHSFYRYTKKRH